MESLSKCSWENAKKSKKDLKRHANLVLDFLKKNAKQLHNILPQVLKQSAMLYGGAGQMLDGVVHAGALGQFGADLARRRQSAAQVQEREAHRRQHRQLFAG